ncbi:MAG: Smr/MutS family protein [Desulfosudis oleivorans]|nr:Smr/MutS family protein [Desulfosudis oleivorans]
MLPIKVVGMRVDEALPLVERAVDRAMLTGQDRLEIIHGAGTGRLKKAIREYLKELPCVKAMHDAPMAEGGGNKTIVHARGGDRWTNPQVEQSQDGQRYRLPWSRSMCS